MLKIGKDGSFLGSIGIEFEGGKNSVAGVMGTKKLIEKTLKSLG